MSKIAQSVRDVVANIDGFDETFRELEAEWAPDAPPIVVSMSAVGRYLAEHAERFESSNIQRIFQRVETKLVQGTELEKDAVATGFLEAIASVIDREPARKSVLSHAGDAARSYLQEWNKFWGIDSE